MPRPLILLVGPPHPCNLLANRLVARGVNTVHKLDAARASEWWQAAGDPDALLLVGGSAHDAEMLAASQARRAGGPPVWRCALEPTEAELQALVRQLAERSDG